MECISVAASTKIAYASTIKQFNIFQASCSDPEFDALMDEHVVNDHLAKLMLDFGVYLAWTDLPQYGNHDKGPVSPATLTKYFGKVKEALKEKFKHHQLWQDEDSWYKPLLSDLEKGAK